MMASATPCRRRCLARLINAALDRAEADRAIVILTGRKSVFSADFDLKVMKAGGLNALRMLHAGYAITARVMSYPYPVIVACNGHVLAMRKAQGQVEYFRD